MHPRTLRTLVGGDPARGLRGWLGVSAGGSEYPLTTGPAGCGWASTGRGPGDGVELPRAAERAPTPPSGGEGAQRAPTPGSGGEGAQPALPPPAQSAGQLISMTWA